jgi:hypothetical protein
MSDPAAILREEVIRRLEEVGLTSVVHTIRTGQTPPGWKPAPGTPGKLLTIMERDVCIQCERESTTLSCGICPARWCNAACMGKDAARHTKMCAKMAGRREQLRQWIAEEGDT